MKNNFKKILIMFFSLIIISTIQPSIALADGLGTSVSISAEYKSNSPKSIELYQLIINKIDKAKYGGMFLDDQGRLNINTVDATAISNFIKTINSDIQNVIYQEVKNSYKELDDIYNILAKEMPFLGINAIDINEKNNCIEAYIVNLTEAKKQTVLSYINKDYIIFKNEDTPVTATTTLLNGCPIDTPNGGLSLTCGATWNDTKGTHYGFLTCAHGFSVGDLLYCNGSVLFGKIYKLKMSGSVDAALIERTNSTMLSSYTFWTDGTKYSSPAASFVNGGYPVGTAVTMYGRTSGTLTGTIQSTDLTVSYDGVTFTGMIKTSYVCKLGDSGGSVKVQTGSGLVYTHVAGINVAVGSGFSVVVDMNKAKNALLFSGYVG